MNDGTWVSLFSGGKDSVGAYWRAREAGLAVDHLLTVHPEEDSYLYHVPGTGLASLAAESMGLPLRSVPGPAASGHESSRRGDEELVPLEDALAELDDELAGGVTGVTVGAIESRFQKDRIEGLCDRLGIDLYAPLWHEDPRELGAWLVETGFEIRIVQVAAAGFDRSWLGRQLDDAALADLAALNEEYGVHLLGEGGEYETIVTDGPHMERAIELDVTPVWEGTRGHLEIEDAWLEPEP